MIHIYYSNLIIIINNLVFGRYYLGIVFSISQSFSQYRLHNRHFYTIEFASIISAQLVCICNWKFHKKKEINVWIGHVFANRVVCRRTREAFVTHNNVVTGKFLVRVWIPCEPCTVAAKIVIQFRMCIHAIPISRFLKSIPKYIIYIIRPNIATHLCYTTLYCKLFRISRSSDKSLHSEQ